KRGRHTGCCRGRAGSFPGVAGPCRSWNRDRAAYWAGLGEAAASPRGSAIRFGPFSIDPFAGLYLSSGTRYDNPMHLFPRNGDRHVAALLSGAFPGASVHVGAGKIIVEGLVNERDVIA